MSRRYRTLILVAVAVAFLVAAVAAEPALADVSRVGRNAGREVSSWGRNLLLGVAALVGIPVLLRRDFSEGLRLVLLVVIVGAFVFATPAIRTVISDLWHAIAG